jgi:hypothetical protein
MATAPGPSVRGPAVAETENSGWVMFAGIILMINGVLAVMYGLAAILNDQVVTVGGRGAIIWDLTTWGWVTLVIGAIAALSGFGLLAGNSAARVLGIVFASLQAIAQFGVITAFPLWSILIIALDVIVIYQLTARWVPGGAAI